MLKLQRKEREATKMYAQRLPVADIGELKRIARREKISVSELVKQVLQDFIAEWKKNR